jgi:hypothetical protein
MLLAKLRIAVIGFFLAVSTIHLAVAYQHYRSIRAAVSRPVLAPGEEYADLVPLVLGHKTVGYLTDLDLSPESVHTGNFLSAQYQFAPIRLDIGNQNHTYTVIDASNTLIAHNLMEHIPAAPVFLNRHGKLLVQKP